MNRPHFFTLSHRSRKSYIQSIIIRKNVSKQ